MLQIRPEQLRALDEVQRQRFLRRLAEHLRAHFPQARVLPEDELLAVVDDAASRAALYGIRGDADVAKLAGVALLLGRTFDEQPWARAILTDGSTGPALRANRVHLAAVALLQERERG